MSTNINNAKTNTLFSQSAIVGDVTKGKTQNHISIDSPYQINSKTP